MAFAVRSRPPGREAFGSIYGQKRSSWQSVSTSGRGSLGWVLKEINLSWVERESSCTRKLNWFKEKQRMGINGTFLSWREVSFCIPQGFVLRVWNHSVHTDSKVAFKFTQRGTGNRQNWAEVNPLLLPVVFFLWHLPILLVVVFDVLKDVKYQ